MHRSICHLSPVAKNSLDKDVSFVPFLLLIYNRKIFHCPFYILPFTKLFAYDCNEVNIKINHDVFIFFRFTCYFSSIWRLSRALSYYTTRKHYLCPHISKSIIFLQIIRVLNIIRITQLAQEMTVSRVAKIVRETVVFNVASNLTRVLSVQGHASDHVIYKSVSIFWWSKL